MNYLTSKGYDAEIAGMCWMQGESDSFSIDASEGYGENLNRFIEDVRRDLSAYAAEDGIAFADACIAENPVFWVYYEGVNRGKHAVAERSSLNVLVDTSALVTTEEPEETPDVPHYDSLSEIRLGHLFGEALVPFLD